MKDLTKSENIKLYKEAQSLMAMYRKELNKSVASMRQDFDAVAEDLENLFAEEEPHWSDGLDPEDNQTWVLCYLSDASAEETWHVDWVASVSDDYYWSVAKINDCDCWKYATPVDLNVRFKKGEE
jgi:hypothetical protein